MTQALWTAALIGGSYVAWKYFTKQRTTLPYPPGPPELPIIGSILAAPKEKEWITFAEWSQTYGDLVSFGGLGIRVVIVNSAKIAADLFEHRSTIYSDRLEKVMLNELMGFDWTFGTNAYGNKWRTRRRALHSQVQQGVVGAFEGIQLLEARRYLQNLLDTPDEFFDLSRGMVGASIMNMTYGIEDIGPNDPLVRIADDVVREFISALLPGSFWIDYISALKYVPSWFPGAGFKRWAKTARLRALEMRQRPFDLVKQRVKDGSVKECMVSRMLSDLPEGHHQEDEDLIRDTAGNVYQAGSDTTVSAVLSFLLAMVLFPEVQQKARDELDRVVGLDRLPEFKDRDRLPYISALISEVWRWQPVGPLAIPHATSADDVYDGYFIPKGSPVIGNAWAMLRDVDDYPNPEEFRPERYLIDHDGVLVRNKTVRDPLSFAFGFGRRICPGRHVAEQTVFAVVVLVLSVFKISPVLDQEGRPLLPKPEMETGLASHPKRFRCRIEPRSSRAVDLIQGPLPDRGL